MKSKFLKKNIYNYTHINKKKKAGRNRKGQIIIRHKGGGIKFFYKPTKLTKKGYVTFFLANSSSRNNFLNISNKKKKLQNNLHIYLKNFEILDEINNTWNNLKNYDIGTFVSHIEHNKKVTYCKSAGSIAQIIDQTNKTTAIRLPSTKILNIKNTNNAFPASTLIIKKKKKKAGYSRWLNKRPSVRGVAMNPVDHPHGGGEGKTSGGRPSVSIWGWYTK